MLTPGQKFFEYQIIRQVGQGSFATVYEALDKILNRRVAIKQLIADKEQDERALKRFVQEARIVAGVEHPNVVTVYSLRFSEQRISMVMEFLPGGSLHDLLKKHGRISVNQAARLTIGICQGLARLHAKHIIHRDIKAENILLTADGRPKVADFGIAHVPRERGGMGLTQPGYQPRTLLFSSPEQVLGERLDPRSDVYQVGELLYAMLTGEHYINVRALQMEAKQQTKVDPRLKLMSLIEDAVMNATPRGLPALWREFGPLAGVIEKALAKNRKERFDDTLELAAAIEAINIDTPFNLSKRLEVARAHNQRGLAHASMRNHEQAIFDYTKAIENDPDFVAAYVNRAIAYTGLRTYNQALRDYQQVLQRNPHNVYAYYNRGNTYIWMGEYQHALADYNRALNFNPEFVAAYVNRGIVYDRLGEYQSAIESYNLAIRLNPDYVYTYFNRGKAYFALGEFQRAITDYNKVIELNPEHPYAYDNRAQAYRALGQESHATRDSARITPRTSSIDPSELSVARSMLMPATPLDFLLPSA